MAKVKNTFGTKAGVTLASSLMVLTSTLAAQRAMAQDDDEVTIETPDSPVIQEQIVVQGVRQSLQNAQDIKRDADTFVDAISAQDIGSLPDRSVLEAMQRLPGVSIERFAAKNDPDHFSAEGSGAVVRGLTFTRTEFNGRDSFTANSGRGLSFQDVPPELMSSVRLYKNQSADMIEGGIGGTVSLHTRVPFDQAGQLIAFSGDTTYYDLNEKWSPTYSGLYSNRWEMDELGEVGLLFGFADSHSDSRSDGIQSEIFQERTFNGQDVLIPNGSNVTMKEDNRIRKGTTVAFQWADPNDTMLATATYLKSDSTLGWNENKISFQGTVINDNATNYETTSMAGTVFAFDDEGVFSNGVLANGAGWRAGGNDALRIPNGRSAVQVGGVNLLSPYDQLPVSACTDADTSNDPTDCDTRADTFGHRFQTTTRVKRQRTVVEDMAFNFKFTPNENWEIIADYQYVEATTNDDDMEIFLSMSAMQDFDISGDVPTLRLVNPWTNVPETTVNNPAMDDGSVKVDRDYFVDPSAYWWKAAMDHYERAYGEEEAMRLDITRSFDDGFITAIKAGVRSSTREQEVRYSRYNWGGLGEIWTSDWDGDGYSGAWLDLPMAESLSDDYEAVDWSSFNRGESFFVPGSMPNHVLHPSRELANDYANWGTRLADVMHPDQWVPAAWRDENNDGQYDTIGHFTPSELSDIEETNNAAYVRFDFETELGGRRLSGNVGVRYFEIELESSGFVQFPDVRPDVTDPNDPEFLTDPGNHLTAEELGFGNSGSVFSTAEHSYDHILPSLNLKFEITDDLLARAAVSKAVALPDIGILRNYMNISVSNGGVTTIFEPQGPDYDPLDTIQEQQIAEAYVSGWQASAGNPFLEPMESIQYDLSLEWYFADVGSLTTSIFFKDLSNFFLDGAYPRAITNPDTGVTQVVNVDGTINSGDGELSGFEFAYQQFYDFLPEPWDGLGTQLNYTYIDAKSVPNRGLGEAADVIPSEQDRIDRETQVTYGGLPLESQSKHTANLVGMWEKGDWSFRLAYNWRSSYLVTARDVINPYRPIWADDSGYLDSSLFYNITDAVKVGFQGTNLTNTVTKTEMQIAEDGYTQGRSWFTNDRRYAFVIRAQF